jgi:O-antigen ligase
MELNKRIDIWLFPLFALPLFMGPLSTAAANISGAFFLLVYIASGYWRDWRLTVSRAWFWPLMGILAINIVGMLWTEDTARGFELLSKLKFSLFILAGATLPWQRKHFILLVRLFLAGLAINAFIGLLQWMHLFPWRVMNEMSGPVGNAFPIFLATALVNALLWIAYDLRHKIVLPSALNAVLAVIFFTQLISTGGRSGHLAFVLLMPVALWMLYPGRWRIWAMAVVIIGMVGLAMSPQVQKRIDSIRKDVQLYQSGNIETSIGLRLVFWEGALRMVIKNPVLGVGTGDYALEMGRLQASNVIPATPETGTPNNPHNSYLAYLSGLGLIGLSILLWFLWKATQEAWQHREHAIAWFKLCYMGVFLVGSFTDSLIWGVHNVFALGLIIALPVVFKHDSGMESSKLNK